MNSLEMFVDNDDNMVKAGVNGFRIFNVSFDASLPIESKEKAIDIAKKFAKIIDEEFDGLTPENYPFPLKYEVDTEFVEGYEGECYSSKEEEETAQREFFKTAIMDMLG